MGFLDIRNVTKSYGAVEVLHRVDIEVEEGEFLVLVGPSGCGKSTLLNMIAGLEGITSGDIAIKDRVINGVHPSKRNIAMVFQSYALYPNMSVGQNMTFGLEMHGVPKPEREKALADVAKLLQIDHLLDRKPGQLSGGQRQRVAMGRAIVRKPAVFLFDEPLSNLDAKLRVQMRLEIRQLQRSLGTTAIYVTHDQVESMTLADRLIVMNAGTAEQVDTPMAVYSRPASLFVAGFIGSPAMNMIPATIAADGKTIQPDGGAAITVEDGALMGATGKAVTVGIRPEHMEQATPETAQLVVHAAAVETLGADTLVHGGLNGPGTDFAVRLPGSVTVREGDQVPLKITPGMLHLFDRETGRRIGDN